ncbi:hypothetical protein BSKO_06289 [Bryopsis sp. KO-2023]|nr:hypothetical protein BSKO_06289 [Bryopsis sp. KO-2023]
MAARTLAQRLTAERSALFVCDVQERFRTMISGMPSVIDTSQRMVRASKELGIPVVVTEQYPKALGNTVEEVASQIPEGSPVIAKTNFSMMVPEVKEHLAALGTVEKVLLVGIEAHVCVLQTTLDLIESNYEVHLLVDGISSSRFSERSVALQRMANMGAVLSTSEMALFQMLGDAKAPGFKAISNLIKEERAESLPF